MKTDFQKSNLEDDIFYLGIEQYVTLLHATSIAHWQEYTSLYSF